MPKQLKDNAQLIVACIAIIIAFAALVTKANTVDALAAEQRTMKHQIQADHDTLTEIQTDVKWIRERLNR